MPPVDKEYTLLLFSSQARNLSIPWEMRKMSVKKSATMPVKKKHIQSLAQARNPTKSWSPVQSTDNMR